MSQYGFFHRNQLYLMNFYKGLRVIDLSRILVGPLATMILADMGAEVIKIESFEVFHSIV